MEAYRVFTIDAGVEKLELELPADGLDDFEREQAQRARAFEYAIELVGQGFDVVVRSLDDDVIAATEQLERMRDRGAS